MRGGRSHCDGTHHLCGQLRSYAADERHRVIMTVNASYSGDPNYAPKAAAAFSQTEDGTATPSITLSSSANPAASGTQVTFTATADRGQAGHGHLHGQRHCRVHGRRNRELRKGHVCRHGVGRRRPFDRGRLYG